MAEQIISPGVFTRENDQSFLPQGIGSIGAAVVGPTKKGPAFVPTRINSFSEYVNLFGTMTDDTYVPHTVANYLRKNGWVYSDLWGKKVNISNEVYGRFPRTPGKSGCRAMKQHSAPFPLTHWINLGIDPGELSRDKPYALLRLSDSSDQTYLVGKNFETILQYNCANKYAVSVGLLADYLADI